MPTNQEVINAYFEGQCRTHKDCGWKVAGYPAHDNQYGTYVVLTAMVNKKKTGTMLDVGCGQGDLFEFIDSRNMDLMYEGLDLCEPMVAYARSRYPEAQFQHGDFLDPAFERTFDYIVAANAMNLRLPGAQEDYMLEMAAKMFKLSRRAASFNLLSKYSDLDRSDQFFYYDPATVLDACFRLTPFVSMNHVSSGYDFTVTLYHRQ